MIQKGVTAGVIALFICAVLVPLMLPLLRKWKLGQHIREDGPENHFVKAGTPTIGGIAFLAAWLAACLVFIGEYPEMLPVLLMTFGFGLVGFLDDFLKVLKKQSEGLTVRQKFLMQFIFTGIYCFWKMRQAGGTEILLPFSGRSLTLGWVYIPFAFLVILGTDNGTNFTDGLDGLCSGVTLIAACALAFISLRAGSGMAVQSLAMAGALAGFLIYNTNKAMLFMGDTGSLALGAYVSVTALELKQPLVILTIGFIYLLEVVSVILQVGYFKLTHGKRLFRMAPIHHHFEKMGWSEPRVVYVFTLVTALLSALTLTWMK